ncbi:hypothetical protein N657DRAFT_645054 [Parathielavia appendiculata]|uniref:Alpha-l-rhamnosidase c n=1 Tax=Parathielavia appendiculata TaxID=2587402 RepID=A0AAN6Z3D6_9PEZI|nr:hypothetical protein N657DRAFT_645054 [Parathielavia appendiculata]
MSKPANRTQQGQNRALSNASSVIRRLSQDFVDSRPPEGFMAVTGDVASSVLSVHAHPDAETLGPDTRTSHGKHTSGNAEKRPDSGGEPRPSDLGPPPLSTSEEAALTSPGRPALEGTEPFGNGYHFPPKYSWQESTRQALAAFWKFFLTPMGFFWTIYGLNVVAWGGMIFLLLCNASPAMCYPTCDDIDSPRRKWIEWDAQILTALFCVTSLLPAPWRFRDLYYLFKYRISKQQEGLRRLAGIHNGWFRLPGSQELPPNIGPDNITAGVPVNCVPIPEKNMPNPPLTGIRAPPTKLWKLDFVIWSMVLNTLAQAALCGIMWGMNRYDRPSWATGFLIAIAMIIAMVGGWVMFAEGKKVKSVEGVQLTDRDRERLARDKELGIPHYNNIRDKKPKEKSPDIEAGK